MPTNSHDPVQNPTTLCNHSLTRKQNTSYGIIEAKHSKAKDFSKLTDRQMKPESHSPIRLRLSYTTSPMTTNPLHPVYST